MVRETLFVEPRMHLEGQAEEEMPVLLDRLALQTQVAAEAGLIMAQEQLRAATAVPAL